MAWAAAIRNAEHNPDVQVVGQERTARTDNGSEHAEQVALFQWADANVNRWPCLSRLFAIPNGGKRDARTAGRLKAEGVRAGVPDVFLPHPVGAYCGLWIEMKYGSNKPTGTQREWLVAMAWAGYKTAVCWGADEAIQAIENYLQGAQQ